MLIGLIFGLSLGVEPVRAMASLYVSPTGTGTDCSMANPCSLQYAVEVKAMSNDVVFVQSGTYTADAPSDLQVIEITKNLTLIGRCQWSGGSSNCGLHNPESILDGENMRRVIVIRGALTDPISVDMEGFRIVDGNAYGINVAECSTSYGPTVSGCGGGVFAHYTSSLNFSENIFWGNHAANDPAGTGSSLGGGLYIDEAGTVFLTDNTFTNNVAALTWDGMGGGIYAESVSNYISVYDSMFFGNIASSGSSHSYGVSISLFDITGGTHILNNFFELNGVLGIAARGGALFADTVGIFQFGRNTIISNTANSMVEVRDDNASPVIYITRNYIWGNTLSWALIWLEGHFSTYIVNNMVGVLEPGREACGGATYDVYLYGHGPSQSSATLWHNTLASAHAGIMSAGYVTAYVENNIISHQDTVGIDYEPWSPSAIFVTDTNLFFDNADNGLVGNNPIYGDPLYTDITLGDLHLNLGSAAIDQGGATTTTLDQEGDPRPIGSGPTPYDLGADEFGLWFFMPMILR